MQIAPLLAPLAVAALGLLSGSSHAQTRKLSAELPQVPASSLFDPAVSADSGFAHYRSPQRHYRAASDGSSLAEAITPVGARDVVLTADGNEVAWREGTSPWRIFAAPVDGSAPKTLLAGPYTRFPIAENEFPWGTEYEYAEIDWKVSDDSSRVVFTAQTLPHKLVELYSVPLDGSTPPLKLSLLPPGADPDPDLGNIAVYSFEVSPDGQWVVYRGAEEVFPGVFLYAELLAVPADGSAAPVQLSATDFVGASVISPDSTSVVFVENSRLHSVPIDGSQAPVELIPPGPIVDFAISPDSTTVVLIGRIVAGRDELWAVALDGSSAPFELSPVFTSGDVQGFAIAPDSSRVAFHGDLDGPRRLYVAQLSSPSNAVPVSGPMTPGGEVMPGYRWAPDSSAVVYRADKDADEVFELYVVRNDATIEKLNPPLPPGGDVVEGFSIAADSSRVVFRADGLVDERLELYSAALASPASPALLNGTPIVGVTSFALAPSSSFVLYLADECVYNVADPFRVPLDGSTPATKIPHPHTLGVELDVASKLVERGGQLLHWTSKLIGSRAGPGGGISVVPPDGSGTALELAQTGSPLPMLEHDPIFTPDGSQVVFLTTLGEYSADSELQRVPADGSAPPEPLATIVGSSSFGSHAYSFVVSDEHVAWAFRDELFAASLDGMMPATQLYAWGDSFHDVRSVRFTPDGSRLAFVAGYAPRTLMSVLADGSQPADTLEGVDHVWAYDLTASGSEAVYIQSIPAGYGLFLSPLDASTTPIQLHGVDPVHYPFNAPGFELTPDGMHVVYSTLDTLAVAPLDGSQSIVELSEPTLGAALVTNWELSEDGSHVAFVHGGHAYVSPLDGATPPVRLGPLIPWTVIELAWSPDGQHVVVQFKSGATGSGTRYYAIPAVGSPGWSLSTWSGYVTPSEAIGFGPDSSFFVFRKNIPTGADVRAVRLDGSAAPVVVLPTAPGTWRLIDDGASLLHVSASETPSVSELFRTDLVPVIETITPAAGTFLGDETIRLLGSGFSPDAEVFFGGIPAESVQFVSGEELRVTTPRLAGPITRGVRRGNRLMRVLVTPLPVDVTVSRGYTETVAAGGFTYE